MSTPANDWAYATEDKNINYAEVMDSVASITRWDRRCKQAWQKGQPKYRNAIKLRAGTLCGMIDGLRSGGKVGMFGTKRNAVHITTKGQVVICFMTYKSNDEPPTSGVYCEQIQRIRCAVGDIGNLFRWMQATNAHTVQLDIRGVSDHTVFDYLISFSHCFNAVRFKVVTDVEGDVINGLACQGPAIYIQKHNCAYIRVTGNEDYYRESSSGGTFRMG